VLTSQFSEVGVGAVWKSFARLGRTNTIHTTGKTSKFWNSSLDVQGIDSGIGLKYRFRPWSSPSRMPPTRPSSQGRRWYEADSIL